MPGDTLIPCDDLIITSAEALAAAYRGQLCELVRADGTVRALPAGRRAGHVATLTHSPAVGAA